MLTLTMPQSDPSAAMNRSASAWSWVKIDDDSPCGTAFCSAMASSRSLYVRTCSSGANVSRRHDVALPGSPRHRGRGVEGIGRHVGQLPVATRPAPLRRRRARRQARPAER